MSRYRRLICAAAIATAAGTAVLEPGLAASPSPYAGEQSRDIKALSPQEVRSLLDGRGMGFAKAAELNGYPGPAHVLELDSELALNDEQRRRTRALFETMQAEAMALGNQLVAAEREVDRLFASGTVTSQLLQDVLQRSGELQARLRGVHLQAHVEQVRILDAGQVQRYSVLRGYGGGSKAHAHGGPEAHGGLTDAHTPGGHGSGGAHAGHGSSGAHAGHDSSGARAGHGQRHERHP
jgi:hypothetical protein